MGTVTVLALAVTVWVAAPMAQVPRGWSVDEIVDVGPVPPPGTCSCIAAPFTVPHHPGSGLTSGPAAPLERVELSPAEREAAWRKYAAERAAIGNEAAQGLAGNPNASLGVAIHLSLESAIAPANPHTEEETVKWLQMAAVQGHHDALRMLGWRYSRGIGVPADPAAAAFWFRHGATRDDPISMTALGLLLAAGRGVPQDWTAAVGWWERAQARAPLAARFAGDAYACGAGVAQDNARAAAAYKSAAERHELSSSIQLGHMYLNGCAEGSDAAAVKAFEVAADQGYPDAQLELSDLLLQARGVDQDPYRAYTFARLAELRLPDGTMKKRATALVKSATRLMNPAALPAQEAMVQSMIAAVARPNR